MQKLFAVLIAGLLLVPPLAEAREFRSGPRFGAQAQDQPLKRVPGPQRGERPQRIDPEKRKPGRLTQEERRELRRDIDRANREIYRR